MAAVNVSGLWGAARSRGTAALGFAGRRGGMMMGRAIRNTEMLGAIGRTGGFRGMASTLGSASWKAAAIGAGVGAGASVINDAVGGNMNRGSFGRAFRGGLFGGAVGGVGGIGNAMFRGNINRIARARAGAGAAMAPMSRRMRAGMVGPIGAARGMSRPMAPQPPPFVAPRSSRTMNISAMGGRMASGRAAMGRTSMGSVGLMPGAVGQMINLGF